VAKGQRIIGKETPEYSLNDVKRLIRERKTINLKSVVESANNMCLTISQAHQEILRLQEKDFYKSTPDKRFENVWQDVYNVNDQVNSPPPGPQLFPTFAMRGVKC
jgi:hypothetical protein